MPGAAWNSCGNDLLKSRGNGNRTHSHLIYLLWNFLCRCLKRQEKVALAFRVLWFGEPMEKKKNQPRNNGEATELLGLSNLWSFSTSFVVWYCTCASIASEKRIYRYGLGNSHCDLLFQVFGCRCLTLNGRWTLPCQSNSYSKSFVWFKKNNNTVGIHWMPEKFKSFGLTDHDVISSRLLWLYLTSWL